MSKQIVNFLKPVEVEAQDGEPSTSVQGRFDFLIQSLVESAAIGNSSKGVVMREKADMLFRLLARPQVSDGNGVVRFPAIIDRTEDQFDRRPGAVGVEQIALGRLVRSLEQFQARAFVGKALFE